jgi:hypothetical protein
MVAQVSERVIYIYLFNSPNVGNHSDFLFMFIFIY